MRIIAESTEHILEGVVADDADLDGTFALLTDDGERLLFHGWLFVIEVIAAS
jgi:hypothetical protein